MNQRFDAFITQFMRIDRAFQRIKAQQMAEFGLKGAHVMILSHLGEYPEGLTAAMLSSLCVEDKAAISRSLRELEDKGLISRSGGTGSAGYRSQIKLTKDGKKICQEIDDRIDSFMNKATQGMPENRLNTTRDSLKQIADNLDN